MKAQYTKAPWKSEGIGIYDESGGFLGQTDLRHKDSKNNAAHIVKCVNLHDKLTWHLAETIELLEMQLKHDLKLSDGARAAIEGRVKNKKDLLNRAKGESVSEADQITRAASSLGSLGGSVKSKAKKRASQANGKLGGRPKKSVGT